MISFDVLRPYCANSIYRCKRFYFNEVNTFNCLTTLSSISFFCENSFTSHKCSSFLNLIKCLAQFIMVVGGFRFVIRYDVDNRCVYLLKRFLVLFSRSVVSEGLFNHLPHCASDFLNSNLWTFRKMRGFSSMKKHWIKKQRCDRISVPI